MIDAHNDHLEVWPKVLTGPGMAFARYDSGAGRNGIPMVIMCFGTIAIPYPNTALCFRGTPRPAFTTDGKSWVNTYLHPKTSPNEELDWRLMDVSKMVPALT